MAILPLNIAASELRVPQVDTSWLANLYTNYQGSQLNQAKLAENERRQGALAELGKLNPNDPNYAQQVAQIALRTGDFSAGLGAINNAAELKLKQEEAAREAALGAEARRPPAAPAPVAPSATVTPAQPAITTQTPLFARPQALQESTPPGGTVAPAIPARTSEAPSPAAQANPVVFAKTQLGRGEIPDRAALQDYMRTGGANLDPATLAWCAAFVNASLGHAGIKGTGSNMARSFLNFGSPTQNPNPGDIAVFQRGGPNAATGHVGFYQGRDANGNILVLGGNQGDRVSVAPFPESQLLGFRKVMPGDSGTAGPVGPTAPGTVAADLRGRGPAGYGTGGAAVASAMPQTPLARTTVAALNPSFTPQTSMTDAGPQLPAGVSPAAPAAQGAAGPPILPNPTPLVPPNISLAALGSPPAGGVGTIDGPPSAANAPSVQMAQAGPYQLPWNFTQPQATPALPQRAPAQPAPVQQPAQARGAASGSPLEHVTEDWLLRASASKRWGEVARAEIARRSTVAADANKTSTDYNDYLAELRAGTFKGTRLEYEQAKKADVTLKRLYDGVVADRASRGLGPPKDGFEQFVKDMKGGVTVNTGTPPVDKREEAFIDSMKAIKKQGDESFVSKTLITNMRKLDVKTGLEATIKYALGEIGIPTQGLNEIQAFQSLLDFMVPSQPRAPGSQSEFEAKTIRSSLPRLITQPGGKELIMNILEAVSDLNAEREAVAGKYLSNTPNDDGTPYTAAQTQKDMQALRTKGIELAKEAAKLARSETPGGSPEVDAGDRALVDKWRTKK